MLLTNLIYFLASAFVLIISGIFLVKSLTKISRYLGISEFSAAFIIMAFATSIPELFIGVSSALNGDPSLSLGNIVGANILDLTIITGIIIISAGKIRLKPKKIHDGLNLMFISIILVIVLFTIGGELSKIDGIILISIFFIHTYQIFKKRKKYSKRKIEDGKGGLNRFYWLLIFMLALIGLFISSNFVVNSASGLAIDLGLPKILIGLLLISIATTLPELIFGISASNLRHKSMAIGDQVGTVVVNSTLILGIVAIIHPITAEFKTFIISAVFMLISAFIFYTFVKTGNKLEKIEGISLILIYVLFVIFEFFAK